MSVKARIRLLSPWSHYVETPSAIFSTDVATDEASALLAEWAPSEELLSFSGPKAWYCCEPETQFRLLEHGCWSRIRSRMVAGQFLSHNHPNSHYRVPHITHFEALGVVRRTDRLLRAVAVVSNFGGGPLRRNRHLAYRNRFVTSDLVDLFGRPAWSSYRRSLLSRAATPANFRGTVSGDWPAAEKRALLASYKVCVCLESSQEPQYFTEKFVEAVAAGCIPVYRAHGSLRHTVLQGARWIDPADYGHDPARTILAALDTDAEEFGRANAQWLESEPVKATHHARVFERIAEVLVGS